MKHSAIRTKIISTASDLFYNQGYNSTGINEIISKSGIAKATLYSHFRSKDDICLAYLRHKNIAFIKDIEDYCFSKSRGKAQILAIFDFLKLFFKDKDFNGCWCINTIAEIPKEEIKIRAEIQSQKLQFISFINKLLSENYDSLDSKQTKVLSRRIYLLYESAVAESHLHQDEWPITEAKNLCKTILN